MRAHDLCRFGNRLEVRYEDVSRALQSRLTAVEIEFRTNGLGEICYAQADHQEVMSLLLAVNSDVRGLDADYEVAGGEFGAAVLESLRNEGIQFDSRENQDRILLYLERPQDLDRVKEVVRDAFLDIIDGVDDGANSERETLGR